METVLIFREWLLHPSETFIVEQARALRAYTPVFAGLRRTRPALQRGFREIVLTESEGEGAALAVAAYRYLGWAGYFAGRLRAEQPSLIHAHFATDSVLALPIAAALDVPLFVTLHGYDVTSSDAHFRQSFQGRHYLKHRPLLFQQAALFLCVSESIRQAALRAGFPDNKLRVQYIGIDCERFRVAREDRERKRVLFVGRLVEKKGCVYLLQAMARVQAKLAGVAVEIIGDGPLRADLEALAGSLGIHAEFRGVQGTEEVRRSMSRARVLCNPSVTAASGDSEGFGMVFAEAQAVGTPVVSSRHAAIPEAVSDGATGVLCAERDVAGLAAALLRFLTDDAYWMTASERAAAWVRERFDLARQTSALEGLFDAAVCGEREP